MIKHWRFRALIATAAGLAAMWALFYTFVLFPWTYGEARWWYMPHFFTLVVVAVWVAVELVRFVENRGDDK